MTRPDTGVFDPAVLGAARDYLDALHLPLLPEPLPAAVLDAHTHADATAEMSGLDPEASLALAASVGVVGWVQTGCDLTSSRWAVDFASSHPAVVAAVAIHPTDAVNARDRLDDWIEQIDQLAGAGPHVRAVGETGLDYHWTSEESDREIQRESFARHIAIARSHGLTVVIHNRDARADLLRVLDSHPAPPRIVMHCFSGDADFARECLDRGCWLSFPGVVTFKNAGSLREALSSTPLDRMLVETDAPYLTPAPRRGKPNAPYLVPLTVRFMAAQLRLDTAELCAQLMANTHAAYGGPWGHPAGVAQAPGAGVGAQREAHA